MLAQELFKTQPRTTALGETMAMAELGEFAEAVLLQRGVLEAAERAGSGSDVARMRANLRRYERGEPCRSPWAGGELGEPQPARPVIR